MKVPTWAYVIGILMMLFGGCNISRDLKNINISKITEKYSKVYEEIQESSTDSLNNIASDTTVIDSAEIERIKSHKKIIKTIKNMTVIDDFTKKWTKIFGYLGLMVSIIYILGGLFLMIIRKFSIKLVYFALGLSIIFSIFKLVVFSSSSSSNFITFSSGFSNSFSIIIDIILLIIILVMDKEIYYMKEDYEDDEPL